MRLGKIILRGALSQRLIDEILPLIKYKSVCIKYAISFSELNSSYDINTKQVACYYAYGDGNLIVSDFNLVNQLSLHASSYKQKFIYIEIYNFKNNILDQSIISKRIGE